MRILVACEFSGRVRDAFIRRGHDAISCDILPTESPGPHLQCDVRDVLSDGWDMLIAFPPCTHLAYSGARWFIHKRIQTYAALKFFECLLFANIPRICVENPRGIPLRHWPSSQVIQPWQFGHGETKETHLWLRGLPLLTPTDIVDGREQWVHKLPPTKDRSKLRSLTYPGVAEAMAEQWSNLQ